MQLFRGFIPVFSEPSNPDIFTVIIHRVKWFNINQRCSIEHIHLFNVNNISLDAY